MVFPEFTKKNGPPAKCRVASASSIKKYKKKLPASLITHWQEAGWCGYDDGFLWFVDPSEVEEVLEDWLEPKEMGAAFLRTAFGDLFLWSDAGIRALLVHHHRIMELTDDMDLFVESSLTADSFLDKGLNRKLYRKAVKKLGPPEPDECYAFEPALALGGPGTLDTLRRVKWIVHLALLAELSGD
jgi:hypothetical protein